MEEKKLQAARQLKDDELEKVAGGNNRWDDRFSEDGSCPNCGCNSEDYLEWEGSPQSGIMVCNRCDTRYRTHAQM